MKNFPAAGAVVCLKDRMRVTVRGHEWFAFPTDTVIVILSLFDGDERLALLPSGRVDVVLFEEEE